MKPPRTVSGFQSSQLLNMTQIFHGLVSAFVIASVISDHSPYTPCTRLTVFLQFLKHHCIFSSDLHIYCSFCPKHRTQPPLTVHSLANFYSSFRSQLKHHSLQCTSLIYEGSWAPLLYGPTIPFPSPLVTLTMLLCTYVYIFPHSNTILQHLCPTHTHMHTRNHEWHESNELSG